MALIPPVSGGAFLLSEEPLSLEAVVEEVASDEAGAVATFVGTTRIHSRGRTVTHLEYEAYEGMAEQVMAEIADELKARYELCEVAIHHRIGRVGIGERSVVIAVSAPHRAGRARGVQGRHRYPQRARPALEERGVRGRRRMDRTRIVNQYEFPQRDYEPIQPRSGLRDLLKKLWAPLAAVGALLVKFGAVLFKAKFLFSIFVSAAVYVWIGGWWFGIGLVVLLFVHEMGHVLEAKRQGLPVSAPFFIPFLGAAIQMKRMPQSAWHEALNGIAGPILGTAGAAVVWAVGAYYDSRPLVALAFLGFLINLFNLVPFLPLDGGRIAVAIHPASSRSASSRWSGS